MEVFGRISMVAQADVDIRRLASTPLPERMTLADLTASRAAGFGATAEIHSTTDYPLTQRWAERFRSAGFDGFHYYCRYDPSQTEASIALFGPAGAVDWPATSDVIPEALVLEVESHFGLTVRPTP